MGLSQSKPARPQKGGLARSNARHGRPAPNKKQQQQQQKYAHPPPPHPKNKPLPPLPKQQQPKIKPSKSQSNMSALGFGDIVADRQYYMTKPLPPLAQQKTPTKAPTAKTPRKAPAPERSFFSGSSKGRLDPSTNNIFLCAPNSGIPSQIPDFALKKQGVSTCRACRKPVNADTDYLLWHNVDSCKAVYHNRCAKQWLVREFENQRSGLMARPRCLGCGGGMNVRVVGASRGCPMGFVAFGNGR